MSCRTRNIHESGGVVHTFRSVRTASESRRHGHSRGSWLVRSSDECVSTCCAGLGGSPALVELAWRRAEFILLMEWKTGTYTL